MNNNFSLQQIVKPGDLNADLIVRQHRLDEMAKFMEIKSINPKLKQSETAKELAIYTSTLQRYRREIVIPSPYRNIQSSNTQTRKQMTSNHTELDLKMTSNDLKMTTNDLKTTSNEPVKHKRIKFKAGDPSDNQSYGRDLFKQAFLPKKQLSLKKLLKKMSIYKTKFHEQQISTTKNHFQRDLKQVKTLYFKVKFLNKL